MHRLQVVHSRSEENIECLIEFPLKCNKLSFIQFPTASLKIEREQCKQLFMLLNYFAYQTQTSFSSANIFQLSRRVEKKFQIHFSSPPHLPCWKFSPLNWNANLETWVIYSILCAQLIPACKSSRALHFMFWHVSISPFAVSHKLKLWNDSSNSPSSFCPRQRERKVSLKIEKCDLFTTFEKSFLLLFIFMRKLFQENLLQRNRQRSTLCTSRNARDFYGRTFNKLLTLEKILRFGKVYWNI